jgi:hypothetical protein
MDLLFRFWLFERPTGCRPRRAAELPVAIEELRSLNYPNFADSQYVAVQDKGSKIAEQPARGGAGQNLLHQALSAQLTC